MNWCANGTFNVWASLCVCGPLPHEVVDPVNEYKVLISDSAGRISTLLIVLTASDDAEAMARARLRLDNEAFEIWQGSRLVGRQPPIRPAIDPSMIAIFR